MAEFCSFTILLKNLSPIFPNDYLFVSDLGASVLPKRFNYYFTFRFEHFDAIFI